MVELRETLKQALPPKLVHAYRLVRHTMFWPTELEMVAARRFLARDKIAVDVGANVGLFSAVLARHSKRIIAFEANPTCAEYLAKVAPRNCEVIAKAISDRAGMTTLRVPVSSGIVMNALATIETTNRFETEARATEFATYEISAVTLDQVLLAPYWRDERVAFLNIDVEGHEFAVLKGGEGMIALQRPVLLIEIEYRHGAPVKEIFDWLKERGYSAHALLDGRNLSPLTPEGLYRYQDSGRLALRMAGDRRAGYVNNIFFLPED